MALMQYISLPLSRWRTLGASVVLLQVLALTVACQMLSEGRRTDGDPGAVRMESFDRMQFAGWVKTIGYSQGGRALVAGGCQSGGSNENSQCTIGLVQVWSLQTTDSPKTLSFPRTVTALAVSPDGNKWIAGDIEGRLILSTAKWVPRAMHQKAEITALAFAPDGKRVASGSLDSSFPLGIMDMATGGMIKVKAQFDPVTALAFSPDGKSLAVGMSKGRLAIWDFLSDTSVQVIGENQRYAITSAVFSSDGAFLAYGRQDGHVVIWDQSSGKPHMEFNGSSSVTSLAFSPDGQYLAIGQDNGKVLLVESKGAHQVWSKRHIFPVSDVAYSPDGNSLAVAVQQQVYFYRLGESEDRSRLHRAQGKEGDRGRTEMMAAPQAVAARTFARVLEISQQEFFRLLPFDRLVASAVRAMVASVPEATIQTIESPPAHALVVQANRHVVSVDLARLSRVEGDVGRREAVRVFEEVQGVLLEAVSGTVAARLEDAGVKAVVAELGPGVRLVRLTGKPEVSAEDNNRASADQTTRFLEDGRIPYLKVPMFTAAATRQVGAWLRSRVLSQRSSDAPILDLRGNPGGELASAMQIASLLIPKGRPIGDVILRKTGDRVEYRTRGGALSRGPFVILVNEQTAGTAEMLACSIRDAGVGVLVGTKTAGVDDTYSTFPLPNREGLRVSTGRFYCPGERSLRWTGQSVDLEVAVSGPEGIVPIGVSRTDSLRRPRIAASLGPGMLHADDQQLRIGMDVALCLGRSDLSMQNGRQTVDRGPNAVGMLRTCR